MTLIDMARAEQLYSDMGPAVETSGGSAGNTAAGIASFGGEVAYIGKVADDHLGKIFRHDIKAIGVDYDTPPLEHGETTARSMYFEGYLWDPAEAKDAIREAARIAHDNDRLVAMTLSDAFCVDRYRDEFLELMRSGTVDICFANDGELKSLYQTSDMDSAIAAIREDCNLSAITMGAEGSMVVTREKTGTIDAQPIDKLVDTTGAGDLYAAGFLFGLTDGRELGECAVLGSIAASEVIQHIGPRPQTSLKNLALQLGL